MPAFLVPLLLAPLAAGAGWVPGFQNDALGRLQVWVERAKIAPRSVDEKRQAELRAILGDLRVLRAGMDDNAALDLGLVQLASLEWRSSVTDDPALLASARLGRAELELRLSQAEEPLALRLAREVLAPAAQRPQAERLLAAELLGASRQPELIPILCAAAREEDGELTAAAMTSLSGWPHSGVHLFFLDELRRGTPCTRLAGEHFVETKAHLDAAVLERLQREVARRYLSEDWREAARARRLVGALDTPRAVPLLIESLAAWNQRAATGRGSKRIVGEVVAELQRLSGRSIGDEPQRWSEWWEGVLAGRIALPADIAAAGGQSSSAAFFGLRAATDRVVFVVDRSSSMRTGFGTGGRSRHEEAVDQLVRFLQQSGEDTRFTVAVFGNKGKVWRTKLSPANGNNLEQVRRWLEKNEPDGETQLFQGVRSGLGLNSRGNLQIDRCEADTVIVLCDGATTEGSGWVARWLAEENEAAQLVFHCVQIGTGGNGTLEALAQGSGGQFVHTEG